MSHESRRSQTVVWLTPPYILDALGGAESFDLDPCAAPEPRPWPTAQRMNTRADSNGLQMDWHGRVWMNPPYDDAVIGKWLARMANHGRGTALLAVRPENVAWHTYVWPCASGIFFFRGRLNFHRPDGSLSKGRTGHASALVTYGQEDLERLAGSGLDGHFQPILHREKEAGQSRLTL